MGDVSFLKKRVDFLRPSLTVSEALSPSRVVYSGTQTEQSTGWNCYRDYALEVLKSDSNLFLLGSISLQKLPVILQL